LLASSLAVARPIPVDAPVIRTTFCPDFFDIHKLLSVEHYHYLTIGRENVKQKFTGKKNLTLERGYLTLGR
jgi:hypothetical protein